MSFLAVLLALLLEQARPLLHDNWVHSALRGWSRWVRSNMDAGQAHHAWLVWILAVAAPAALVAVVHVLLIRYSLILTFVWAVAVLYVTLGFRQFSHHFTDIRGALERGDASAARTALANWKRVPFESIPPSEVLRLAIEHGVQGVHRHVLGVMVCFLAFWLLGLGPAGAVLFRLADYLFASGQSVSSARALPSTVSSDRVRDAALHAWQVINYIPARATATAFAVVGNFEEAVANWRSVRADPTATGDAVVLAAAAGALNLRIGKDWGADANPLARAPELAHLASLVGLVWRSVVLWMLFLALVTLAHSVG
jgi:adenosylcobinamide-phosphate synthase